MTGTAVEVLAREDMHVAGLLLGRILEGASRVRPDIRLRGNVLVDAGGMRATVVPTARGHEVRAGAVEPLVAALRAPLPTLVALAGGGGEVRAVLLGGLRAKGSLRALWAMRALLRAERRSA